MSEESKWIKTVDRLPTEKDADCHGEIWVTIPGEKNWVGIRPLISFRSYLYTHWMPTGLKQPEPPEEE